MRNDLIELLALLVSVGYPNRGSNTIFRVYVEVEYYDAGESGRKELPSGRKKR